MSTDLISTLTVTIAGGFVGDHLFNEEVKVRKDDDAQCKFKPTTGQHLTLSQDFSKLHPSLPLGVKIQRAMYHPKYSRIVLVPQGDHRKIHLYVRDLEYGAKNPTGAGAGMPSDWSATFKYHYSYLPYFSKLFKNCTWREKKDGFVSLGPDPHSVFETPEKKMILDKDLSHIDTRLVIGSELGAIHVADNFEWMKFFLPQNKEIDFVLKSYSLS
jgi:hypothetical protein